MTRRRRALAMAGLVIAGGLVATAQVKDFRPVTDAMLENPRGSEAPSAIYVFPLPERALTSKR